MKEEHTSTHAGPQPQHSNKKNANHESGAANVEAPRPLSAKEQAVEFMKVVASGSVNSKVSDWMKSAGVDAPGRKEMVELLFQETIANLIATHDGAVPMTIDSDIVTIDMVEEIDSTKEKRSRSRLDLSNYKDRASFTKDFIKHYAS